WRHQSANPASKASDVVVGFIELDVQCSHPGVTTARHDAGCYEGLVVIFVGSRKEGDDIVPNICTLVFQSNPAIENVALCDVVACVKIDDVCGANRAQQSHGGHG